MDRINVVYAADDNYASLAGISMLSLFENNKEIENLSVYILSDKICKKNQEKLRCIGAKYQREIFFAEIAGMLSFFQKSGANGYANADDDGYAAYAKLLIPDLLSDENRVIYLDCDTLVLGSLSELVNFNLEDRALGMVQDCLQNKYKRFINIDEHQRYFNSGVIVFDIPKWKENSCMERMQWHLSNIRNQYPLPDQDLINVTLHEDIYRLNMKYNYLSQYFLYPYSGLKKVYDLDDRYFYTKDEYAEPSQAVVLHFCGQTFIRPWFINSKHPAKKTYDYYYNLSPWKNEAQKTCRWLLQYRIQYLLWKYSPTSLSVLCGKVMQRLFIKLNYKV